ncbi:MAG: c-type cytochrome [Arcobacteraceae bacterium]|nr:c-type cytochrome [Arcobacteraceae bacterium]
MRILITILFMITLGFSQSLFLPLPQKISYNKEKVDLGKNLFFDPLLSRDKDISCHSCHFNYGADREQFSIGTDNQKGFINTPSVFNLPYKIGYFWNGRSETLEEQMIDGPFFNKHEMASSKEVIEKRLLNSPKYIHMFQNVYHQKPNFKLVLDAIVEFQNTLISKNSKFDKYLRHELELSLEEQKGMELFISYGCASCHNGINLGGNSYQKFGTVIELRDNLGQWEDRYKVTGKLEDKNVFIVPGLRNVEKTAPYFHSGHIKTLKEAIMLMGYYNIGVVLTKDEIHYIEKFLQTVTGDLPETF